MKISSLLGALKRKKKPIIPEDLVGLTGVVVRAVTDAAGQIKVTDLDGLLHFVNAKAWDSKTVFGPQTSVRVAEYKDGYYYVVYGRPPSYC
jgi:hypothetical protein